MTWPSASHIGLRLLAFNLLVVFVPSIGVLYLDVYERRLLDAQERAMVQQGRIFAAAVGGGESLDEAAARDVLRRVRPRSEARLRVFDHEGRLIADSAALVGASDDEAPPAGYGASQPDTRNVFLYRVGAALAASRNRISAFLRSIGGERHGDATGESDNVVNAVVAPAMRGQYGAATRPTPGQRSVTLYSALPILNGETVVGAVVVSQSSFRILQALYDVRLRVFRVVITSMGMAALLTVLAATTIVRPLTRLRRAATSLAERRTSLLNPLPGVRRHDEIGDLARALQDLTGRLHAHIGLLEGFAADVAHEFKNPLAGIRSAAETIDACEDPAERSRFIALIVRDVGRLERLVTGLRDLARLDRQIEDRHRTSVAVADVVRSASDALQAQVAGRIQVAIHGDAGSCRADIDEESLAQVVANLLSNAISFAPEGSTVDVTASSDAGMCLLTVADRGPGIPASHLDRVFDRFFTYRPDDSRREHVGLGLSIVKRIVEGHGGTITVANREGGGAVFDVRLRSTDARG